MDDRQKIADNGHLACAIRSIRLIATMLRTAGSRSNYAVNVIPSTPRPAYRQTGRVHVSDSRTSRRRLQEAAMGTIVLGRRRSNSSHARRALLHDSDLAIRTFAFRVAAAGCAIGRSLIA